MALESMFPDLSPLLWAERPKSPWAIDAIRSVANRGDARFKALLQSHVRDGICDDMGNLMKRWDGLRFVVADRG